MVTSTTKSAVISGATSYIPISRDPLNVINLTAGQTSEVTLKSIYIIRDIYLTISIPVLFGTTAPVASDIQPGDEWGFIQRADLRINNGKIRTSLTGEQLVMMAYLNARFIRNIPSNLKTLPAASTAATFTSTIPLLVKLPTVEKPLDFSLNANFIPVLSLSITAGSLTNFLTTAGATLNGTPTITISTHEALPRNIAAQPVFNYLETDYQQVGLSNGPLQDLLLPTDTTYLRVFLNSKTNAGLDVNAITAMELKSAAYQPLDCLPNVELEAYYLDHQIPRFISPFVNTYFLPQAWIPMDFVRDKYVTEALNLIGQKVSGFKVSTNLACNVNAIMLKVQPTVVQTISTTPAAAAA